MLARISIVLSVTMIALFTHYLMDVPLLYDVKELFPFCGKNSTNIDMLLECQYCGVHEVITEKIEKIFEKI